MQDIWGPALLLLEIAGGARNPVNMDISRFRQRIRAWLPSAAILYPGITAIRMPPPARS
jgi:hypothetical protein